jgi:uncharacterized protein (TIGR03437 family)
MRGHKRRTEAVWAGVGPSTGDGFVGVLANKPSSIAILWPFDELPIMGETGPVCVSVLVPSMLLDRGGWTHARTVAGFPIAACSVLSLFLLFSTTLAAAPPSIAAIENNYSYIPPGSPNYGIAQGSLFIIFGNDLANSFSSSQGFPLATSLSGTSLSVRVDGTTTSPALYYVMPGQIAAILPSATPAGVGVLTVTNNGKTSQPMPIQVVQTEFGIDTLYGGGFGPAVAQHANGQILGPTSSANPGETIVVWGSGAGPDPNNDETTYPQKQNNLTNLPMEVDIGGISATISYRGRSPYPGVDQIDVVVPASVPPGCWVSVVVWTETHISNFATIPVAANGATCSDQSTGYTGTELASLLSKPSLNVGTLGIGDAPALVYNPANVTESFSSYTPAEFVASLFFPVVYDGLVFESLNRPQFAVGVTAVSIGSCIVVQEPRTATPAAALDAGVLNLHSDEPEGTPPADPVQISNGPGGKQVGPFTAQATVPAGFLWQGGSSEWFQGITVTWTGAAPDSFVQLYGLSSGSGLYSAFTCSVPASAATFAVPSVVLQAMAPDVYFSEDGWSNPYFLAVTNYTYPQIFSAQGIDLGTIYGYETIQQP